MKQNGIISAPVINTNTSPEPVSVNEIKDFLHISNDTEVNSLSIMGKAARKLLEHYTGRYFKPVNITVRLKNELGNYSLPYMANGAVIYKDTDAAVISDFDLEDAYDYEFTATFDTGYTSLPEDLKQAILMQVAFMYANRGDDNNAGSLSKSALALANSYRVISI